MNEKIQELREIALNILKPSKKDLEHGLELHANSFVCESYGFMPRAAVNGDVLRAAIEAKASWMEIHDLREEMMLSRCADDPIERAEVLEAWREAGVSCILQNAGEEGNEIPRLLKRLAHFTYLTDLMRSEVQRAATPEEIEAAWRAGRKSLYMTANGVPLPQEHISVEEEMRYISIFFRLGVRQMHLTYNRRNMIGDGCAEAANAGLSDFGRAVIAEMNRVGVIIDVAHSGWRTSLEAAQASCLPVVASHSGCAALNAHFRCKPDDVIRAICDTGGYIGICCIGRFLGRSGDIVAFLDHIDYAAKKFGPEHVAIGTDVAYVSRNEEAEMAKVESIWPKVRPRWEGLWPDSKKDYSALDDPEKVKSMAWTNWPLFTVGLVQRGYSDEEIQKIIGGNVLRVAKAVWEGRQKSR